MRVSAKPFGPEVPVTIYRLGVLLAFLDVVYYKYPSLPRTSSIELFPPTLAGLAGPKFFVA